MAWIILFSVLILVLAYFIHRGTRNTPFTEGEPHKPFREHVKGTPAVGDNDDGKRDDA